MVLARAVHVLDWYGQLGAMASHVAGLQEMRFEARRRLRLATAEILPVLRREVVTTHTLGGEQEMDCSSYGGIIKALDGELAMAGVDEYGNRVIISRAWEGCVKRTTYLDNGWALVHYYHEDGTVEELFEAV